MSDWFKRKILRRIMRRYGLLPWALRSPLGPRLGERAGVGRRLRFAAAVLLWQAECYLYDLAYPYPERERDIMAGHDLGHDLGLSRG